MPIYEYRCDACAHELESIQRMSDPALVDCPECERPSLKRMVSAPAFRLKGSGWYETDFKKDNRRNLADTQGAGESKEKPASTPQAKSESKAPAGDVGKKDAGKAKPATKEKGNA